MRWTAAGAILVTVVLVAGCSSPKEILRERTLPALDVMRSVDEKNNRLNTLQGSGSITIESPGQSYSAGFELNLRKPDSLRLEFSGPLGIDVGTLMLARDTFVFYNTLDNKAIVGTPDEETLSSVFNFGMKFDDIVRAFAGEFGTERRDSLLRFAVEDGDYVVLFGDDTGQQEYRVEGDAFVAKGYRLLEPPGSPRVVATASDIDSSSGVAMPMLVRIVFPGDRRRVTIAYDDITANQPVECHFSLPSRAEITYR